MEIHLDVTQQGASIVDQNREFSVNVGEQFDLELLYDDLRPSNTNKGAFSVAADIAASSSTSFRPVVSEVQIFSLRNISNSFGGFVTVSAEGTSRSREIPFLSSNGQPGLFDNTLVAIRDAVEFVLDVDPEIIQIDLQRFGFDLIVEVYFRDGLTLQNVSNLTIDTATLTGGVVTVDFTELPAFNGGNPLLGINQDVFYTSIDFRSASLDNQPIYQNTKANIGDYDPFGSPVFDSLAGHTIQIGGNGALGIDSIADSLGVPYDGTNIEVLSVRLEVVGEGSGIEFTAGPSNHPVFGTGTTIFDVFGGTNLAESQILFDTVDDPAITGDDRRAVVIGNFVGVTSDVSLTLGADTRLSVEAGEFVITEGSTQVFRRSVALLGNVVLTGAGGDQRVTFDFGTSDLGFGDFDAIPSLVIDGGGGSNTLAVIGADANLDLTETSNIAAANFQTIDLSDPEPAVVQVNAGVIDSLSPASKTVFYIGDKVDDLQPEDQLNFTDGANWRMIAPIADGEILVRATHQTTGQVVEASVLRPWRNIVSPSDVNNDGQVQASDALRIINALFRGEFTNPDTDRLSTPGNVSSWPGVYPDQNGDNRLTALDALRVINDLAQTSPLSQAELMAPIDLIFGASMASWDQEWIGTEYLIPGSTSTIDGFTS